MDTDGNIGQDTAYTPEQSATAVDQVATTPGPAKPGFTFTPAAIGLIVLGTIFAILVVWFVVVRMVQPTPVRVPVLTDPPAPTEEATVDLTAAEPNRFVDLNVVADRDPAVLGLRVDATLGRIFTEKTTGRTLYVSDDVCEADCLNSWIPYVSATGQLDTEGALQTIQRVDSGAVQYTWKGQALYTYRDDSETSVLGDGYEGVWRIARP